MTDLNMLIDPAADWVLTTATAINDSGQIVGYGRSGGEFNTKAFLLTPIPEPSTFALLIIGAVGLCGYTRRVGTRTQLVCDSD